jgi:hypothetical protein
MHDSFSKNKYAKYVIHTYQCWQGGRVVKALVLGSRFYLVNFKIDHNKNITNQNTNPKGRGFESHPCHDILYFYFFGLSLEICFP